MINQRAYNFKSNACPQLTKALYILYSIIQGHLGTTKGAFIKKDEGAVTISGKLAGGDKLFVGLNRLKFHRIFFVVLQIRIWGRVYFLINSELTLKWVIMTFADFSFKYLLINKCSSMNWVTCK